MIIRLIHIFIVALLCLPAQEAAARAIPLRERDTTQAMEAKRAPAHKRSTETEPPLRLEQPVAAPVTPVDTPETIRQASPTPLTEQELEAASPTVEEPPIPVLAMGSAYQEKGLRIAMLLPLSGPSASVGQSLLNAAQLALFETKAEHALLPFDTQGTESGALIALENAMKARVDMALGPVTAAEAKSLEPRITADLPVLTFAYDAGLASHFLVFGFQPGEPVKRVADYAAKNGVKKFSALVPDNDTGSAIAEALKPYPAGTVQKISFLDYKNADTLAKLLATPAGTDEHSEGLLLAENGDTLLKVAGQIMADKAASRFQILGLNSWDDPALLKQKPLVGAWFAVTPPELRYQFELRYKETYAETPPRIASLGYDAIALVAALSQNRKPVRADFLNQAGFAGINGSFRFTKEGIAERLMGVAEITEEGFVIVDPVPDGF